MHVSPLEFCAHEALWLLMRHVNTLGGGGEKQKWTGILYVFPLFEHMLHCPIGQIFKRATAKQESPSVEPFWAGTLYKYTSHIQNLILWVGVEHEYFDRQVLSSLGMLVEAVTVDITTIRQYSVLFFSSILKDVHETLVHKMCVKQLVSSGQKYVRAGELINN